MSARRAATLAVALSAAYASAAAADGLGLELNRLEAAGANCRIYMVASNQTDQAYSALQVDLVTFNSEGVINGRVAVELAPLEARKTAVKLFDLPEVGCDKISRILLNDIVRCETTAGPVPDCTKTAAPTSRAAAVTFFK